MAQQTNKHLINITTINIFKQDSADFWAMATCPRGMRCTIRYLAHPK